MQAMEREFPDEWVAMVQRCDREDPGHFVEWQRLRDAAEVSARPTPSG
jgi:hypothetical protein